MRPSSPNTLFEQFWDNKFVQFGILCPGAFADKKEIIINRCLAYKPANNGSRGD